MTTILVTGATGTVGSEATRALLEAGADVRVGVRDPAKAEALVAAGAKAVRLDLDDPTTLGPAFNGVSRVFLVTAFIEDPLPHVRAALEAARGAGVEFVLRLSVFGADPGSEDGLARTHGRGEELVRDSGIGWAVIRPTFFMDNLLNYTGGSLERDDAFYGAAQSGKISYISSRDIGRTAAAILTSRDGHQGQTYELTGPEALDNDAVAAAASRAFGRTIRYVDVTPEQFEKAALAMGLPPWAAGHMVALEAVKANGWAASMSPSVESITGEPGERYEEFLVRRVGDAPSAR